MKDQSIRSFLGQGVCVWGQKTLQGRPSKLDRVNVRRLLIRLKKFIRSSSRFLVFEQNTSQQKQIPKHCESFLRVSSKNSGLSGLELSWMIPTTP